jgi:predicted RND superfamily exporter protein
MSNWVNSYVHGLFRFRWLALLGVLLVTALMAYGAKNLTFKSDYRIFFGDNNPQLQAHDSLERKYTKADSIIFVVQPHEGTVFDREVLDAVAFLSEESWYMPRALRVDSLSTYQHTRAEEDDLTVEAIAAYPQEMTDEDIAYLRDVALNEPFLAKKAVALDERTTAVATTFQLPDVAGTLGIEIATAARDIQARAREKYPNLRIELTGTVMLNVTFSEVAINDFTTLFPLMLVLLIVTIIWFLRSAWAAVATLVVVLLSAVVGYGGAGWLGFFISAPTSNCFVIILTVAVADSIHLLIGLFKQMREGKSKREAMAESMRLNMQPVFLTSFTTAIGFVSLNFADAPPLQHLGNISAIGAIGAYFYSVVLLPILVDFLPIKATETGHKDAAVLSGIADYVIDNSRKIIVGTMAILAISISFLPQIIVNDKFVEFFSTNLDFRNASDFAIENLTGIYIVEFSLGAEEPGGIAEPEYLQNLQDFEDWITAYPAYAPTGGGVQHINSFNFVMRKLNKSMNGDDPDFYRLPDNRELAAQYLLMYEMSLPEGQDLNNQINVDKSSTRVSVTMGDVASSYMRKFSADGAQWLTDNKPASMASMGSGVPIMFSFLTERNVLGMVKGTGIAFILISITLMFALKSFRMGMISLIPNFLPAIVVFGIWSMLYGEIGLYAAFVTSTALGLIVDFTVHFLSKYLRARREKGLDAAGGIRYAMANVGSALWVTAAVLIAGFMALTMSNFLINSLMGLLTAMIIAVALVFDFLFLPALLLVFDKEKR